MIQYQVRSIQLLNLVNDIKTLRLVPDAYFQRNLVWREVHKKDFIKTILLGLPFPQIFISKGKIDIENMSTVSCLVDGQQRCDAIMSYIDGQFDVDGKLFSDLNNEEKSQFFKYEVAVIELDIENTDEMVLEIFQRINRTSNSLTGIEKLASEYSASEFMCVCNFMTNQIFTKESADENLDDIYEANSFKIDPNVPDSFYMWTKTKKIEHFNTLINSNFIFSSHEIARKVNLMYTLNMVSSFIGGLYTRNENAKNFLETYRENFTQKDEIIDIFEKTAIFFHQLKLPKKSLWNNKANFFSLFIVLAELVKNNTALDLDSIKSKLIEFVPSDEYKIAAKEGVNNLKERAFRAQVIRNLLATEDHPQLHLIENITT